MPVRNHGQVHLHTQQQKGSRPAGTAQTRLLMLVGTGNCSCTIHSPLLAYVLLELSMVTMRGPSLRHGWAGNSLLGMGGARLTHELDLLGLIDAGLVASHGTCAPVLVSAHTGLAY